MIYFTDLGSDMTKPGIIGNFINSIERRAASVMPPCHLSKDPKNPGWINRHFTSGEQRLILGATALVTQPFIDFHNRNVDEKTRDVSVCRTVAKIIVGTTTGVLIRKGAINLIGKCSLPPAPGLKKIRSLFFPKVEKMTAEGFLQYKNTMGTIVGLLAMLVTNFAVDAPFTKLLTNRLLKEKRRGVNELA